MNRRNLLKSIGALGVMPMIPVSSIIPAASATTAVSSHTYKWAEMIVRAHKKISPGMLERLLKVDAATASTLKSQLLEKGVISAQANSFGIHSAVKPLYEGAFMRPSSEISKGLKKANETLDKMMADETTDEEFPENESEISDLEEESESETQEEVAEEATLPV